MSTLFRTVCATLSGAEAGAAARILQGLQYKCSFSGVSVQRTQIIASQHVCGRCFSYFLARRTTGVQQWEKKEQEKENEKDEISFESLCRTSIRNLKKYRFTKSSNINKIFDRVGSAEDLALAEKALTCFRYGLSKPRPSLPLAVIRACSRVGKPRRGLHFVRNKVSYGVFPSRRVYNVLMDSLLEHSDAQGVIAAYKQLLEDEVQPNAQTYHLATIAHAKLGKIEEALALSQLCAKESKLATVARTAVIKILIEQKQPEKALELTHQLLKEGSLPGQTALNLKVHVQVATGDYAGAVATLEAELCNHGNQELGVPHLDFPQLQQAVQESTDEGVKERMKVLVEKLNSFGLLPSDSEQSPSGQDPTEQSLDPTTEQSSGPDPTTEQSSGPDPTTEQSSGQDPTEQSSGQDPTTEQSSGQDPTTEQSSGQDPTTEQSPSGQDPTTEQSSGQDPTEQSSGPDPTTEQSSGQDTTTSGQGPTTEQSPSGTKSPLASSDSQESAS